MSFEYSHNCGSCNKRLDFADTNVVGAQYYCTKCFDAYYNKKASASQVLGKGVTGAGIAVSLVLKVLAYIFIVIPLLIWVLVNLFSFLKYIFILVIVGLIALGIYSFIKNN